MKPPQSLPLQMAERLLELFLQVFYFFWAGRLITLLHRKLKNIPTGISQICRQLSN